MQKQVMALLVGAGLMAPAGVFAASVKCPSVSDVKAFVEQVIPKSLDRCSYKKDKWICKGCSYSREDSSYSCSRRAANFTLSSADGSRLTLRLKSYAPLPNSIKDWSDAAVKKRFESQMVILGPTVTEGDKIVALHDFTKSIKSDVPEYQNDNNCEFKSNAGKYNIAFTTVRILKRR